MNSFLLCLAMCEYSYATRAPLYPTVCGLRHAPVIQPPETARLYWTTRLRLRAYFRVLYPRPRSRLLRLPFDLCVGPGPPTRLSCSSSRCWVGVRPPILARSSRRLLLSTILTLQDSNPEKQTTKPKGKKKRQLPAHARRGERYIRRRAAHRIKLFILLCACTTCVLC